jgi:Fic family protein
LYFKTHRQEYYEHLQRVRTEGDWEKWLRFFLTGVMQTAGQATDAARSILSLFEKDRAKVEKLGRPAGSALRVHEYLQRKPITSVPMATKKLGLTEPTIRASLAHLQKLGIVKEMTGRQRNRLFVYRRYLDILDEGTEPLHR